MMEFQIKDKGCSQMAPQQLFRLWNMYKSFWGVKTIQKYRKQKKIEVKPQHSSYCIGSIYSGMQKKCFVPIKRSFRYFILCPMQSNFLK